jgi:hypothetical protein
MYCSFIFQAPIDIARTKAENCHCERISRLLVQTRFLSNGQLIKLYT